MSIIVSDKLKGIVSEKTLECSPQSETLVLCDGKGHRVQPEEVERHFVDKTCRLRFKTQPPFWDIAVNSDEITVKVAGKDLGRCRIIRLNSRDETSVVCEIILENPNT